MCCEEKKDCKCEKCCPTTPEVCTNTRVISRTPVQKRRSIDFIPMTLPTIYGGKVCYECETSIVENKPDCFMPTNNFRCKVVDGDYNGEVEELYVKTEDGKLYQLWITVDSGYEGIFDAECVGSPNLIELDEVSIGIQCEI